MYWVAQPLSDLVMEPTVGLLAAVVLLLIGGAGHGETCLFSDLAAASRLALPSGYAAPLAGARLLLPVDHGFAPVAAIYRPCGGPGAPFPSPSPLPQTCLKRAAIGCIERSR